MRKILPMLFVALFALAQLVHATEYDSRTGFVGQWEGKNWKYYALVAVLVCIAFNTLVYMLGEAFHLENMKRWAKAEFLQVSASALIIVFVVLLLFDGTYAVFKFIEEDVVGSGSTFVCQGKEFRVYDEGGPIEAVKCKLQEHIYALDNMYTSVYSENFGKERDSATCFILFGMPVYCGSWDISLHQAVEQAHLLGEKIVPLQVALHGQYALAMYVANNMLSVFLPLGILLRIFPITRGVGGLFIAVAVGFYFVFPVMFVLLDPSFVKQEGRPSTISQDEDMCYPGFKGSVVMVNAAIATVGVSAENYNEAGDKLALLTVKIMFYPFVALAMALIFIRLAAPLLGGDTGEIMRMVAKLA